ncbi:hypothetical protein CL6EHI_163570B [Entamoeba histolytica]|uniref:Roadblock/LAMTOR2 domain-containing protein n=2 Tax=Entamoeba TaxID=5758 RepID=A0A175JRB0_ENTHI|nr:hypothetical protein ENU1_068130 [Entamoeba nuttalli P19]EKE41094.1 hypothetical protein ENU1_068130 [Entamoeba nuttalli P19]GAT96002.1 hypothetical protein CL6EHI_163570B [Entamoeba histolytica]|eukprot:XP_008856571.1 hypothetical protein ENU1_068130 [Entamoeba nuttalli P19]
MLNVKQLYQTIESMISVNIEQVTICTQQGKVLTYAGSDEVHAEVIASMFSQQFNNESSVREIILHYENGPIYVTPLSPSVFLVIIGSRIAHLGLIVQKAKLVKEIIGDSLEQFVKEGEESIIN